MYWNQVARVKNDEETRYVHYKSAQVFDKDESFRQYYLISIQGISIKMHSKKFRKAKK